MYRRGLTCFSCHDVHGTNNYAQLIKPATALCLDCHGPSSPNGPRAATIEAHTHHKTGSAGSECVSCRMPAMQTEGVPGVFVHARIFSVIPPEMTDRYKVPNPCTSCHADKTTGAHPWSAWAWLMH
jgi:predicted CXXCH cytochrome family protein